MNVWKLKPEDCICLTPMLRWKFCQNKKNEPFQNYIETALLTLIQYYILFKMVLDLQYLFSFENIDTRILRTVTTNGDTYEVDDYQYQDTSVKRLLGKT